MFSWSELQHFKDHDPAFKILKPWWDVLSEHFVVFMIMIAFSAGTLQMKDTLIICIPVPEGLSMKNFLWNISVLDGLKLNIFAAGFRTSLDTQQYYVINQWCYDDAVQWFAVYFPCLVILHSVIFLTVNNFWFKFPHSSSKIEHFTLILGKCLESPWTTKTLSKTVSEGSNLKFPVAYESGVEKSETEKLNSPVPAAASLQQSLGNRGSAADLECSTEKVLDKKEGEQAKALFEAVKIFRIHAEEEDLLHKMYKRQTIVRTVQSIGVLTYVVMFFQEMKHIFHCIEYRQITGYTDFYCLSGLWSMFNMLSIVYMCALGFYTCLCLYILKWIFYHTLKEYSFETIRQETGMNDIPDVKNDFAFLLHLIDQYDKLYARTFAVFLSDVNETKLLKLSLNQEWTRERLKQQLTRNEENKVELLLSVLPGIPLQVYDLTEIEVLRLECMYNFSMISAISKLKSLKELWLYNCCTEIQPQALSFLQVNLNILRLRATSAEEVPSWIYSLKNLQELFLEGNLQTDSKPPISLSAMKQLTSLHLKIKITKLPVFISDLAASLQQLTFHNEEIKLTTLFNLKKLYYLKRLRLLHCSLDIIPSVIFSLKNLEELDLKDNNIKSVEQLASFQHLQRFTRLRLSHNCIATIPTDIVKISNLEMVHLKENKISVLPLELFNLRKLNHLNVSHNCISKIPPDIGQLVDLQHFSVTHNDISELPNELFKCSKLKVLMLSYNIILSLSPLIQQLSQLRFLTLEGNKLEKLPVELGACTYLQNNNLVVEKELLDTLPAEVRRQFQPSETRAVLGNIMQ